MLQIIDISEEVPIVDHYMSCMRDINQQQNLSYFNFCMERLGEILATKASNFVEYSIIDVQTPFGVANLRKMSAPPVLYAILRAGAQLQQGARRIFDYSNCGFCTCEKKSDGSRSVKIYRPYIIDNKTIIICDPIMTSGTSMIEVIKEILKIGTPRNIIIMTILSTPVAIKALKNSLDIELTLITCSIDSFEKGVRGTLPGLGDAGDLLCGEIYKLSNVQQ